MNFDFVLQRRRYRELHTPFSLISHQTQYFDTSQTGPKGFMETERNACNETHTRTHFRGKNV